MTPPSIHRSLLIRCGLGVGVLLCLLSVGVHLLVRASLYSEMDASIEQTASLLANQVELENGTIIHEWKEGLGTNSALIEDGLFQFWDEKSGKTVRSPALHSRDLPGFSGLDDEPEVRDILLPGRRHGRAIGLRIYPFVLPEEIMRMRQRGNVIDPKSRPHLLVVARNVEPIDHTLDRLGWFLAGGTFLTLGLGFLVIRRVVQVTLRPIDELALQMHDRAEHQLDSALVVPRNLPVELASLAHNFDSLLGRVAAIRQREKDFIRHTAHELRTPIAGLRATTDLALSQPRDAAAYVGHLAACQKTAIELGELVKRLSALSRVGQAASTVVCETVDVAAILQESLGPFLPQFRACQVKLKQDISADPLSANGDATLIRIIFNNLLDNAVSYAIPGSEVQLVARIDGEQVVFRISNRAESLPENMSRLFEPLFRQDPSHAKASAHLGIGLTLSLEAATVMGATLQAHKTDEGLAEFTLKIPRAGNPGGGR